jgi:release factor glutamine methyltransferase
LDRCVREYEPIGALDGGPDGLVLHRRILAGAGDRLVSGGRVYLEIAFDQGQLAKEVGEQYEAFEDVRVLKDHAGKDRVLTARKK